MLKVFAIPLTFLCLIVTGNASAALLHDYAAKNDANKIATHIRKGDKLEGRDKEGRTALHISVITGSADAVKTLLKGNANVNAVDGSGRTPLMYAVVANKYDIGWILNNAGADIYRQDKKGYTATDYAKIKKDPRFLTMLSTRKGQASGVYGEAGKASKGALKEDEDEAVPFIVLRGDKYKKGEPNESIFEAKLKEVVKAPVPKVETRTLISATPQVNRVKPKLTPKRKIQPNYTKVPSGKEYNMITNVKIDLDFVKNLKRVQANERKLRNELKVAKVAAKAKPRIIKQIVEVPVEVTAEVAEVEVPVEPVVIKEVAVVETKKPEVDYVAVKDEAQSILKEAEEMALKIEENAIKAAQDKIDNAEGIVFSAEEQALSILEEAKKVKEKADRGFLFEELKREAMQIAKFEADKEINQYMEDSREEASRIKDDARKQANKMIDEANERLALANKEAGRVIENSKTFLKEQVASHRQRLLDIEGDAKDLANEIVATANKKAIRIEQEAEQVYAGANERANKFFSERKISSEKIAESIITNANNQKQVIIDEARSVALNEVKKAEARIEGLESAKLALSSQVEELENRLVKTRQELAIEQQGYRNDYMAKIANEQNAIIARAQEQARQIIAQAKTRVQTESDKDLDKLAQIRERANLPEQIFANEDVLDSMGLGEPVVERNELANYKDDLENVIELKQNIQKEVQLAEGVLLKEENGVGGYYENVDELDNIDREIREILSTSRYEIEAPEEYLSESLKELDDGYFLKLVGFERESDAKEYINSTLKEEITSLNQEFVNDGNFLKVGPLDSITKIAELCDSISTETITCTVY